MLNAERVQQLRRVLYHREKRGRHTEERRPRRDLRRTDARWRVRDVEQEVRGNACGEDTGEPRGLARKKDESE